MRQSCASATHRQQSRSASPSSSRHQSGLNGKLIMACIIFARRNEQTVCSHTQMTLLAGNCLDVCRAPRGWGGVHILIALRDQQKYILLQCAFKAVEGVSSSTWPRCEPEQLGNRVCAADKATLCWCQLLRSDQRAPRRNQQRIDSHSHFFNLY